MVKYLKPINNILTEIKESPGKGIFLVGEEGSGKTATLLEYVKQNKNTTKPVIDVTLISNYSLEVYGNIAKLFQVSNVILKMLLYIKDTDIDNYIEHFIFFNARISNIQKDIVTMYSLGRYNIEKTSIDKTTLNHPEILLEEFLNKALKYLNYQDITIILDNFDVEKPFMRLYQTYMYELLKNYLRVIATISDPQVINNWEKLNKLSQNNDLIMMNYNRDVNIVKIILDNSMVQEQNKKVISKKVSFMFKDDTIKELINKTNGNLFVMKAVVNEFFQNIAEINPLDYDYYLLGLVDKLLGVNSILIDRHKVRKLYL